jgi:hypothetical protein
MLLRACRVASLELQGAVMMRLFEPRQGWGKRGVHRVLATSFFIVDQSRSFRKHAPASIETGSVAGDGDRQVEAGVPGNEAHGLLAPQVLRRAPNGRAQRVSLQSS